MCMDVIQGISFCSLSITGLLRKKTASIIAVQQKLLSS